MTAMLGARAAYLGRCPVCTPNTPKRYGRRIAKRREQHAWRRREGVR